MRWVCPILIGSYSKGRHGKGMAHGPQHDPAKRHWSLGRNGSWEALPHNGSLGRLSNELHMADTLDGPAFPSRVAPCHK